MTDSRILARNETFMTHNTHKPDTFSVSLRKSKRISLINKKRKQITCPVEDYVLYIGDFPESLVMMFPDLALAESEYSKLVQLDKILDIEGLEDMVLLQVLKIFAKVLVFEESFSRKIFQDLGVVQKLVKFVKILKSEGKNEINDRGKDIVEQAILCLCNLAACKDEFSRDIEKTGVIEDLLHWVSIGKGKIKENAVWTLANLMGDWKELSDKMIEIGLINLLSDINIENEELGQGISLCLANMTQNMPSLNEKNIEKILKICISLQKSHNSSYLWVLSNMAKGEDWVVDRIIQSSISTSAFCHILSSDPELSHPSALILCSISGGSPSHCEYLLEHNMIDIIYKILPSLDEELNFLAFNLLRNIIVDNISAQTQVKSFSFLTLAVKGLSHESLKVRKEACKFVFNLSHYLTLEDEKLLIAVNIFENLQPCLDNLDNDIVIESLKICNNLLKMNSGEILKLFQESQLVGIIDDLQYDKNELVSNSASYLIDEFLSIN